MAHDYQEDRQIRIFISSTFRDMMDERNYLVTRVFPELRRYCDERDISLFELDLRWGVTQEESENQMAFKICLDEVNKTKPFFIGLLGERYGWVPDEKTQKQMTPTKVFDEYPWILEEFKKKISITEAEIFEGAILPVEKINAYFYIRSPKMATPAEFCEDKNSHGEKMLADLKERIRNDKRYSVKDYDNIEHLGKHVEKDFKALVDALFPGKGPLTALEKERLQQFTFLKSKTRSYIENVTWNEILDKFAKSDERAFVVTGESGMGKCALLANWIVNRQKKNEKIIYHFTGVSQSGGDHNKITQRLIDEVRDIYFKESKINADNDYSSDNPQKVLENLLLIIPKNEKLIIILDSLDRLNDVENAKMLNWLPEFPRNVKFVFSSVLGDKTMEALALREYRQIVVDAPSKETRKKIITKYFEKFSKKLAENQIEKIISDKKSENPLVLIAMLDDLRIFGNFDIFDQQIDERLSQAGNESLFNLFLQNIEAVFKNTGTGRIPKNLVKNILSLIAVSRHGLTETEIVNISKVPKLYWSQFSNCMAGHLITINGYVTIGNSVMFNSVKNRYLKDEIAEKPYRESIAKYMDKNEEVLYARKCDELPFQLLELKDFDKLYNFLLDIDFLTYIYNKDEFELGKYWRNLREKDNNRYSMEKCLELNVSDKTEMRHFYFNMALFTNQMLSDYSLSVKFAMKSIDICNELYGEYSDNVTSIYNFAGQNYVSLGEYDIALNYYNAALGIKEKIYGKDHPETATSFNNLGRCYSALGDYQKALDCSLHVLKIEEQVLDKDDDLLATYYNNIGSDYNSMADFKKALEYYGKSLVIREKTCGKEHPDTAFCYNNIATCYDALGEYEKELEYFLKALTIFENYYGKYHSYTKTVYGNIGECYRIIEDNNNALKYHNLALEINEKLFGTEHPDTALSLSNIGLCYEAKGDTDNSFLYTTKALEIRERILGEGHPEIATSYCNLGTLFKSIGDYDKALEYLNKALEIDIKKCGHIHTNTAKDYNFIGICYDDMGEYEESIKYFKMALEIQEKVFEKENQHISDTLNNIGFCYKSLGEYEKSLEYLLRTVAIQNRVFGEGHVSSAMPVFSIGENYSSLEEHEKALEYFTKAAELYEKHYGKFNADTGECYHKIAETWDILGNIEKALENDTIAMEIRMEVYGHLDLNTTTSINNVGYSHYHLGNYEKALEFHLKALEMKKEIYETLDPEVKKEVDKEIADDLAMSNKKVGKDYEALGNREKALEYYNEALSIIEPQEGFDELKQELQQLISS